MYGAGGWARRTAYEDGHQAWFELRIRPYRDGLIVLSVDVSQREDLECEMASGVAHDLGNLLNPIHGHVELLGRRLAGDPDAAQRIARIAAMIERGNETVARLRDYARPAPARPPLPIAIDPIALEATTLCRSRVRPGATFVAIEEMLGAPPPIALDGPDLLSATVNLVNNAIDAQPDGGRVVVRTGVEDGEIFLAVDDHGVGMAAEVVARATEPFFTTKGAHGTGLGLAMAHACAQRHGGALRIVSAPGEGTSISLRFRAT